MFFFFFNDTATTEIYTLSLHDALPIYLDRLLQLGEDRIEIVRLEAAGCYGRNCADDRSEEHTSELQSHSDLVCRLLLEKKKDDAPMRTDYHPASLLCLRPVAVFLRSCV